MSCNGCRILRKGCSENCILRQCLQWIESPEAQANATVFVAKFFGRACLMSFVSAVPENQRPSLFQSLLFEAVGRTINPVGGAVGLLWTGNWHVCQAAAERVLRGGALQAPPEFDDYVWCINRTTDSRSKVLVKKESFNRCGPIDVTVGLGLTYGGGGGGGEGGKRRAETPSEESETTTFWSAGEESRVIDGGERKLLELFI